jgi:hypothetical protein
MSSALRNAKVAKSSKRANKSRSSSRGSKPGERRGGRQKGTSNKRTVDLVAAIAAAGCDPNAPFLFWARVLASGLKPKNARDAEEFLIGHGEGGEAIWSRPTARMLDDAAEGLAPYLAPKRKPVDAQGDDTERFVVELVDFASLPPSGVGVKR